MTRKEFIKICGLLGVGLPLQPSLSSCARADGDKVKFSGKAIIIGAGAGGLAAAYLLQQLGVEFEILEASSIYGGRMRINTDFADFPIPLGAEWLETDTGILREIVNDASVPVNVKTIPDKPDHKFVNYSWFNFFEEYIVPSVSNKITYNTIVQSIDYSGEQVIVTTQNGQQTVDKVIVSVPLKMLQDGTIDFQPGLPQKKLKAINTATIWEGFKAFFEFTEKFYDQEYVFPVSPAGDGEKIYYDAAFGQNTSMNILGLFVVGKPARDYMVLSNEQLKNFILNELDELYSNQASPKYIKHISQNWNDEAFIKSGYLSDNADWRSVRELGKPVKERIYFAGGEYTDGEDWVSVHAAAQSAKNTVTQMMF